MKLSRAFFTRSAHRVGTDLLGATIVRKNGSLKRCAKIIEVEIYPGPHDRASHAYGKKRTPRNAAEYMVGGHVYIYMVYGMYWQFNISTGQDQYPACVLIRALAPCDEKSTIKGTNGPGKLSQWLHIDKKNYAEDLTTSPRLWIEGRKRFGRRNIMRTPRIGIDYAGREWALKPLRLYLRDYERFLAKPTSKFLKKNV